MPNGSMTLRKSVSLSELPVTSRVMVSVATELAPKAAIVVLTASDDEKMAVETIRLGAQDCLRKIHALQLLLPRAVTFAVERQRQRVGA